MPRLAEKVAIVTGGGSGIGAATAETFAREGAVVVIGDINHAAAQAVAEGIAGSGATALALEVDIADEAAVTRLMSETVRRFGRIDVLHNNAALTQHEVISADTSVVDISVELWDRIVEVDLRGTMLCCRHAIPHMRDRGGSIINMSSTAALRGAMRASAYSAVKAGVDSLTRSIAAQYGRQSIRCNSVLPGLILTPAAEVNVSPEHLRTLQRHTMTPYVGRPQDIADLVLFLASDESRFVTGQQICCDGGLMTINPTAADQREFLPG